MSNYITVTVIVLVSLSQYSYCQRVTFPCSSPPPTPTILIPDIQQVKKFNEALQITQDEFNDAVVTQANIIEQISEAGGGADNEDIKMSITGLITKYGYPVEEHEVQTSDGYLLTMQRIPGNGSIFFLMHGLFESAADFVTAGPESALAYYLHNKGYDVWMGNVRGNKYSQKHIKLTPNCSEFWDFSIDEVGRYDLPAMIDYVLNNTGHSKLSFVGHSFGNTAFFIMCSELPAYNPKISVMVALCPVAFMTNMEAVPFRYAAIDPKFYLRSLQVVGLNELVGDNIPVDTLMQIVCGNNPVSNVICSNVMFLIHGFDLAQQNITNLPVNFGHALAGASAKCVFHYVQEAQSGRFCRFDKGSVLLNQAAYKSNIPPDYPLQKVTAPVALFYSNIDKISNVTDVERLRDALPNVVQYKLFDHYWHFDYIWALNVNTDVNPLIHDLVQKYQ